jgi:hypothetical protein
MKKEERTKTLVSLIKLFPKTKGRKERVRKFVSLCYSYRLWYLIDTGAITGDMNISAGQRSQTHNQIMSIVAKLFLQPGAGKIFGGAMPDRIAIREMILSHYKKYSSDKPGRGMEN